MAVRLLQVFVKQSDPSVPYADWKHGYALPWPKYTYIMLLFHRDILSELFCRDIAKEFVRSNYATCRVIGKMWILPGVRDKPQYDLGVPVGHCRAQPCLLIEYRKCMFIK